MNKEQVLKLAEKTGLAYFPGCACSSCGLQHLTAFANACCDMQRESDAVLCDVNYSWNGADIQEAIRANKGE